MNLNSNDPQYNCTVPCPTNKDKYPGNNIDNNIKKKIDIIYYDKLFINRKIRLLFYP